VSAHAMQAHNADEQHCCGELHQPCSCDSHCVSISMQHQHFVNFVNKSSCKGTHVLHAPLAGQGATPVARVLWAERLAGGASLPAFAATYHVPLLLCLKQPCILPAFKLSIHVLHCRQVLLTSHKHTEHCHKTTTAVTHVLRAPVVG
jgi:hypothetical protein